MIIKYTVVDPSTALVVGEGSFNDAVDFEQQHFNDIHKTALMRGYMVTTIMVVTLAGRDHMRQVQGDEVYCNICDKRWTVGETEPECI